MGWIGCVCCEKSRRDFVARTFALIAPVHPVLHRVSCSYETIPNAPKYYATHQWGWLGVFVAKDPDVTSWHEILHYATHQNMSLRSNGADWVRSLWKIPIWLHGTNFCINCTSSPRFALSFLQLRNDPKCTQTLWNTPKHEVRVQWGGSGAFVWKNYNVT